MQLYSLQIRLEKESLYNLFKNLIMNYKDLKPTDFELIPKGENITARTLELDIKKDFKIFIFSEKTSVFSCLLPVSSTLPKLPEINGLIIQYQLFGEAGSEKNNYILLECRTKAYLTNYTEILKEIISEYDKGNSELLKVINKIISKWRHFLAQPASLIMKEDEIVGLLGELIFLSKLIQIHNTDALSIWTAERGEEDFISSGKVIEVKTTLKEKHEHIINGIDQLLIRSGRVKHILSLLLLSSASEHAINLPAIVKECAEMFADDPKSYDLFFKKLKIRGYDARDYLQYLEFSYVYNRGAYFNVDSSFPKLTKDELAEPLNSRISKLRYSIDMEGLPSSDFLLTDLKEVI
jgi:hypothetical protein